MFLSAVQPRFGAVIFEAKIQNNLPKFDPIAVPFDPGLVTLRPLGGNDIPVLRHSSAAEKLSQFADPQRQDTPNPEEIRDAWRDLHQELNKIEFLKRKLPAAKKTWRTHIRPEGIRGLFQAIFGANHEGNDPQIQRLMINGILARIAEASLEPDPMAGDKEISYANADMQ